MRPIQCIALVRPVALLGYRELPADPIEGAAQISRDRPITQTFRETQPQYLSPLVHFQHPLLGDQVQTHPG